MKLFDVDYQGDNIQLVLSDQFRKFLDSFFATKPTQAELQVLAHLQTFGHFNSADIDACAKEFASEKRAFEEAFQKLIKMGVIQTQAVSDSTGRCIDLLPAVNLHFRG